MYSCCCCPLPLLVLFTNHIKSRRRDNMCIYVYITITSYLKHFNNGFFFLIHCFLTPGIYYPWQVTNSWNILRVILTIGSNMVLSAPSLPHLENFRLCVLYCVRGESAESNHCCPSIPSFWKWIHSSSTIFLIVVLIVDQGWRATGFICTWLLYSNHELLTVPPVLILSQEV